MFGNFFDLDFQLRVHLFRAHSGLGGHFLDDVDEFSKDLRAAFLDECHEFFDFVFFRFIDDQFVALFHEKVYFFSQLAMIEKSVIDLNEAIILILGFLILPKELGNVFVSLEILGFEFFKPFLGLFDADLLHR